MVAVDPVLRVPVRFAPPRLIVDFFVAVRLVAAADRLPPAERFAVPCLLAAPLDVDFLRVERLFPR